MQSDQNQPCCQLPVSRHAARVVCAARRAACGVWHVTLAYGIAYSPLPRAVSAVVAVSVVVMLHACV